MQHTDVMNVNTSVRSACGDYLRDLRQGIYTYGLGGLYLGLLMVLVGPDAAARLHLNTVFFDLARIGSSVVLISCLVAVSAWALYVLTPHSVVQAAGERSTRWFRQTSVGFTCLAAGMSTVSALHFLMTGSGRGHHLAALLAVWALMLFGLYVGIASLRGLRGQRGGSPRTAAWFTVGSVVVILGYLILVAYRS